MNTVCCNTLGVQEPNSPFSQNRSSCSDWIGIALMYSTDSMAKQHAALQIEFSVKHESKV